VSTEPPSSSERLRPLRRTRQFREFEAEPLDAGQLDALVDVARWTGSSSNTQPWRFIVITEPSTLRAIHQAGLPQTRGLETAVAAIAIVLPADPDRAVHDAYDDGRVAERLLVAASILDIGAGISWIRTDVRLAVAEILHLPPERMVRTIVQLGHPTVGARAPKAAPGTARLPRDEVVFQERWPAD
jgi:nitroreductase